MPTAADPIPTGPRPGAAGSSADRRRRAHLRSVPDPRAVAPGAEAGSPVGPATAVQFSDSVRRVVRAAQRMDLRPPVFRSPPRIDGVDRSIRRRPNGTVVVAIRRTDRPLAAVRADIIDGVLAANRLGGAEADRFRHAAWAALESADGGQVDPPRRSTSGSSSAGPDRPARVA